MKFERKVIGHLFTTHPVTFTLSAALAVLLLLAYTHLITLALWDWWERRKSRKYSKN